ncbi:MAG: PTS glucose transporter subunit IIA [Psychrobium sp.]|nr:PTS glucose transporter subunit IIA [Psychrobium sp.]
MTQLSIVEKATPALVKLKALMLLAPISGETKLVKQHSDVLISHHLLGRGIVIHPVSSRLLAPCSASVTHISPSGHHITLTTTLGVVIELIVGDNALLSHGIGIVKKIHAGQLVYAGDVLLELDLIKLKQHLNSIDVALLVSKGALKITPQMGQKRAGQDNVLKLIIKLIVKTEEST